MFAYATERLRLSEGQAYERITVARRSRAFPALLDMIADGRLTLTAAAKLGPHLTQENAVALLARAVHATRRQVEILVAELAPKPDVASSVRKLPARRAAAEPAAAEVRAAEVPVEVRPGGPPARRPEPIRQAPAASAATVVATSPARFRVQFTASAELEAKIARARALLRHKIPSGDVAAIIDEAVTRLVAELERARCGEVERPRSTVPKVSTSRDVPAAVKRAVWRRDESRCTFVDRRGRRCASRDTLEIHHVEPFGKGGVTSVDNLRLLCRSHNQYQAELDYGAECMAAHRGTSARASEPVAAWAGGTSFGARGEPGGREWQPRNHPGPAAVFLA